MSAAKFKLERRRNKVLYQGWVLVRGERGQKELQEKLLWKNKGQGLSHV